MDQLLDISAVILVVSVGVDNDVSAEGEAFVEPNSERAGQSEIGFVPDNVINAQLSCNLRRSIRRAVIDYKELDRIDSSNVLRNIAYRFRQRTFLIVTGYLNDEFQMLASPQNRSNSTTFEP